MSGAVSSARYRVVVEEVRSADDFILLVDLGVDGLFKRTRARLFGVDAPNAYKAHPDTEAGKLREEIRRMVSSASCDIVLVNEGRGGWLVDLFVHVSANEPVHVNRALQARGYVYERRSVE